MAKEERLRMFPKIDIFFDFFISCFEHTQIKFKIGLNLKPSFIL